MATATVTTTNLGRQSFQSPFNYYGSPEAPPLSEMQAVFGGNSPRLRKILATVHDLRQHDLSTYTIDRNAFQIVRHSSAILPPQAPEIPDLHDEHLMNTKYWPELSEMLKEKLGVRAAIPFSTTIRDVSVDEAVKVRPDNPRENPKTRFNPFFIVHCDYTPPGAREHMRGMLPSFFEDNHCAEGFSPKERDEFFALRKEISQAEDDAIQAEGLNVSESWNWSGRNYAGPRWALLSVWRPLETVHRDPLGVLLGSTKFDDGEAAAQIATSMNANRERDLPYVPFERMYNSRPGFAASYKSAHLLPSIPDAAAGEGHAWGYVSEQNPDEVLLLKIFDSEAEKDGSNLARIVGHSAFPLPDQDNQPCRRSVEVRFIVIW